MENERCKRRKRRSGREEEEVLGVESEVDLSITTKEVARWCLLCLPRCRKGKGVSPQIRLVRGWTSLHFLQYHHQSLLLLFLPLLLLYTAVLGYG